jgi:CCGSCS motif protein
MQYILFTNLTHTYKTEDYIMFNFFNVAKDQNEMGIEQENSTIADKYPQVETETAKTKPVHGEDGVCCGGCGGQ